MSNSTPPESDGEGDRTPAAPPSGGYGAAPPTPPAYGEGVGWSGAPAANNTKAIMALALGLLGMLTGLLCFGIGFFIGVPAIVLGLLGRREVAESGGKQKGRGLATTGLVLGVIDSVLIVVVIILYATGAFTPTAKVG